MAKRLIGIHLLDKEGKVTGIGPKRFETGDWARISDSSAEALIGGRIHLHMSQDAPSYYSGRILSYRTITDEDTGLPRRIFLFTPVVAWTGTLAANTEGAWGMEQKRIYEVESMMALT